MIEEKIENFREELKILGMDYFKNVLLASFFLFFFLLKIIFGHLFFYSSQNGSIEAQVDIEWHKINVPQDFKILKYQKNWDAKGRRYVFAQYQLPQNEKEVTEYFHNRLETGGWVSLNEDNSLYQKGNFPLYFNMAEVSPNIWNIKIWASENIIPDGSGYNWLMWTKKDIEMINPI